MDNNEKPSSTGEKSGSLIFSVIDFLSQFKYAGLFLLLAGVIFLSFPVVSFIRARDKMMICQENLKNIGVALEMYSCDCSGHYPNDMKGIAPQYIKNLPTCPSTGTETYSTNYRRFT